MALTFSSQHPLAALRDPSLLRHDAFIDNTWLATKKRFAVNDPATGEALAQVADAAPEQAQAAIAAAQAALPAWRAQGPKQRSQLLRKWFELILAGQDDLACLITAEQGKPLSEARKEVLYGANFVEWFAEEAKRIYGETVPSFAPERRALVLRQPIGVCAAITPWNFPLAMITRKVAPALAAGCTVVLKPAELTPLSALALAELAQRAGMPAGVFNVITTTHSAEVGQVLCASPVVRHLSFTGSTEVGRTLMAQCAPSIKKLSLELGGNAPFIVFDDADLDSAASGAIASKYRNAGQTCVCANRLYVQDGVYDAFVQKLAAKVAELPVGNGFAANSAIGPLIGPAALAKVQAHLQDAIAKGGRIVSGGHALQGHFFAPTVIAEATPDMLCATQETFGPLAPVFRFKTEQEAIDAANATEFGLASYLYSRDIGRIVRVSEALEYGMVGVNTSALGSEQIPFGGIKQSGLGREGARQGIDEYLELKYISLGGLQDCPHHPVAALPADRQAN